MKKYSIYVIHYSDNPVRFNMIDLWLHCGGFIDIEYTDIECFFYAHDDTTLEMFLLLAPDINGVIRYVEFLQS